MNNESDRNPTSVSKGAYMPSQPRRPFNPSSQSNTGAWVSPLDFSLCHSPHNWDRSCVDSGTFPAMDGRLGAPLLPQQV